MDAFGLVEGVDRLCECIVVGIANAADGRFDIASARRSVYLIETYWADSIGRRNTANLKIAMNIYGRASDRCTRKRLRSPGHPLGSQRENPCRFWQAISADS